MTEREFATDVVSRLQRAGHAALFAGGCVRDELLGLPPADFDVATSAIPDEVKGLFRRCHGFGASFGVVEVLGPKDESGEWLKVQVATFRSDGTYSDGRRPDAVTFSSPAEDAARRDFTINGLFLDPLTGEVIDHVGGRADLAARVLRAIGDPVQRFTEDKLRVLRAVRMAARFELTVDPATAAAAKAMASQIKVVSAERIAEELRKLLTHQNRARGVVLLQEFGLMTEILPEAASPPPLSKGGPGVVVPPIPPPPAPPWKGGEEMDGPPLEGGGEESRPISFPLAFAALLDGVTPKVAANVCRRLRLSNDELDRIVWLVGQRRALIDAAAQPRSRLFPLLVHPGIDELIALTRAEGHTADADECERLLRDTPPSALNPPPLLTGDDLRAMGLAPGPRFKTLLETIRADQLDDVLKSPDQAREKVRSLLGQSQ